MADRIASAEWHGDLFEGAGQVSAISSGLFTSAGVTWAARTEVPGGKTSPEELLAGAHAACFCMAFANELSSRGHAPSRVATMATATFEPPKITKVLLDVSAEVPGIDAGTFQEAFEAAQLSCPVSNALRGNVEIEARVALT